MHEPRSWSAVVAGMFCLGLSAGLIGVYGFFVEPLSKEFGVGVAVLNIGPVAFLLVPGLIAPFVGKLADRLPAIRVLLTGVCTATLALAAISQAPSLLWAAAGFLVFVVGLTGYGPVVINGLMVKLYQGREARALALAAIGISIASATLPPLVGQLLAVMSWRETLLYLSVGLSMLLVLAISIGIPRGIVGTQVEARSKDTSFYRRREFWIVGFCVALAFNVSIVLAICYPPHFSELGYSPAQAGWFIALAGVCGLLGKSAVAWLGDAGKHYAKWLVIGLLLVQVLGLTLLLLQQSIVPLLAAVGLLGFGGGAFIPMHPYLNSRYFDLESISHINGAQMPLFLPFGLLGAPLAGLSFDHSGNYHTVIAVLAVVLCMAIVLALNLPRTRARR